MRNPKFHLAAFGVLLLIDAHAAPITTTFVNSANLTLWSDSAQTNRYSNFSASTSESRTISLPRFNSALGTLLSAELTLVAFTAHPTTSVFLPEVSGLPTTLPFGAFAQDTERTIHNLNLYAFYDASVSYRADYRLTVDPINSALFAPTAAEAAFGSCQHTEDLFLDIGEQNPYCMAGNNGSPLGDYTYNWGIMSGLGLDPFVGDSPLTFGLRMTGDMFGYCDDDDVGDYCRLNLAMTWNPILALTYRYESSSPDPGDDGGDPVSVPEPGTATLFATAFAALAARRRRTRSCAFRGTWSTA